MKADPKLDRLFFLHQPNDNTYYDGSEHVKAPIRSQWDPKRWIPDSWMYTILSMKMTLSTKKTS